MKLLQAITTYKMELIDMINSLYQKGKDNLGLEFGDGRIRFGNNYFLTIPKFDDYFKPFSTIELYNKIEYENQNYAVSFRIKAWTNSTSIRIEIHDEEGHVGLETILHLGEDNLFLLDRSLYQDILFYTCYEKVVQYLIEESLNDINKIKKILSIIKNLKENNVLSFCIQDWYDYVLLVNDSNFKYKRLASTNSYAPILIGDYIKDYDFTI